MIFNSDLFLSHCDRLGHGFEISPCSFFMPWKMISSIDVSLTFQLTSSILKYYVVIIFLVYQFCNSRLFFWLFFSCFLCACVHLKMFLLINIWVRLCGPVLSIQQQHKKECFCFYILKELKDVFCQGLVSRICIYFFFFDTPKPTSTFVLGGQFSKVSCI